jgi:hypothetical protein
VVYRRSTAAPAVYQGINGQDPPAPLVKVDRNGQPDPFVVFLQKTPVVSNITKEPFHHIKLLQPGPISSVHEDHVWFEDRWMVASWCDE